MTNLINRIDRTLKTKEDLQSFVLVAFVLFILFVKCYMMVNTKAGNSADTQRNAEIVKTHANANS